MNIQKVISKFSLYLLASILLVFTSYPFLYMITTSFKDMSDFFANPFSIIPKKITFQQFISVFEMGLTQYFINSVILSVVSVFIVVCIASLASYPLSRMNFKMNRTIFVLFLIGMMIPIHATLIPIFIMSNNFGFYDTLFALLGPYVAFALPISIFIFTQFMKEIPAELEEAAEMDGANHWEIFLKVILPNMMPAISTVVIYNFVHIWNEFIFALVLIQSPSNMPLPMGLQKFYGEFSVNVPGLMAALSLASLPLIFIFLIAQEKVVKGLTSGSVKG